MPTRVCSFQRRILLAATTESRFVEIGAGRTGNGYAFIDFIGDATNTDFGLRIIRENSGANTNSTITHRGTGGLILNAEDAGFIRFQTSAAARFDIGALGQFGVGGGNYGTSGQVLTSGGASAAPSWASSGSMTLLGTLTTTSGTTQTLSGLTLTGYIGLIAVFNGVGHVSTNSNYIFANCTINATLIAGGGQYRGILNIDLATGSGVSTFGSITAAAPSSTAVTQQVILRTNITTASTSISMTTSASTFNAGSISIYGVK
jgi:hypothetical protein